MPSVRRRRTRRGFLAASTVTLLTGCGTRTPPTDAETPAVTAAPPSSTESETESATDGTPSATETPTVSADAFAFDAETKSQSSEESPARFELSLTNESDRTVEMGFQPRPPFGGIVGETEGGGKLVVVPDNDAVSPGGETWTGDCWVWSERVLVISFLDWRTAEPGATFSASFDVYGHPDDEGCPADGTYVFENTVLGAGETQLLRLTLSIRLEGGRVAVTETGVEKL